MNAVINDRRTDRERETHTVLVVATDAAMSGWGGAEGMVSYAAWAVDPKVHSVERVFDAVNARAEMKRVRIVSDERSSPYRPGQNVHLSIYPVKDGHPYSK